jgi:hypothetical protein
MRILVWYANQKAELRVSGEAPVEHLHYFVQREFHVAVGSQLLFFAGRVLSSSSQKVASYNIQLGAVLYVLPVANQWWPSRLEEVELWKFRKKVRGACLVTIFHCLRQPDYVGLI